MLNSRNTNEKDNTLNIAITYNSIESIEMLVNYFKLNQNKIDKEMKKVKSIMCVDPSDLKIKLQIKNYQANLEISTLEELKLILDNENNDLDTFIDKLNLANLKESQSAECKKKNE